MNIFPKCCIHYMKDYKYTQLSKKYNKIKGISLAKILLKLV